MKREIWKNVPDFKGYYKVSNLGRLKSLKRIIKHTNGHTQTLKEKIIVPRLHCNYLRVRLIKNKEFKDIYVHKLVSSVFKNHTLNYIVKHKNKDKIDNKTVNLFTLYTPFIKLIPEQIIEIRNSTDKASVLSQRYNVNETHIYNIKAKKTWKNL